MNVEKKREVAQDFARDRAYDARAVAAHIAYEDGAIVCADRQFKRAVKFRNNASAMN